MGTITVKELNSILCSARERDDHCGKEADYDDLVDRLEAEGLTRTAWEFIFLLFCTKRYNEIYTVEHYKRSLEDRYPKPRSKDSDQGRTEDDTASN